MMQLSSKKIFRAISIITVGQAYFGMFSPLITQCDPRRPKGASGGHKVSVTRAAQASEARLFEFILGSIQFIYPTYRCIPAQND